MNRLSPASYCPVYLKRVDSIPVLMDLSAHQRFSSNSSFMKDLEKLKNENVKWPYFGLLRKDDNESSGVFSIEEVSNRIKELSFRSMIPGESQYSPSDWTNFLTNHTLAAAERFYDLHKPTGNAGSGRHVLLKDLQIKGCGRNLLAQRLDFEHATGRLSVFEGMAEYLSSHICANSLPFSTKKVFSVSSFKEDSSSGFILRDSLGLRMSQVARKFQIPTDREVFYETVRSMGGARELLGKAIFQYASAAVRGFSHLSLIPENAMLDGSFIDTSNVTYSGRKNNFLIMLIFKTDKVIPGEESFDSISDLLKFLKPGTQCTGSNIFYYTQALYDIWEVLTLNSHIILDIPDFEWIKSEFIKQIKELFKLERGLSMPSEIQDLLHTCIGKGHSPDYQNVDLSVPDLMNAVKGSLNRVNEFRIVKAASFFDEEGKSIVFRMELGLEDQGEKRVKGVTNAAHTLFSMYQNTGTIDQNFLLWASSLAHKKINSYSSLQEFVPDLKSWSFVERSLDVKDIESFTALVTNLPETLLQDCMIEFTRGEHTVLHPLKKIPQEVKGWVLTNIALKNKEVAEYWFSVPAIKIRKD